MFVTYEEHKTPFSGIFGDGEMHWRAAELALQRLWFLVSVSDFESLDSRDSFRASRTMLLSRIADVEELAELESASHLQLESVFIVTPGHVNGTNRWKMEPLRASWKADEPSAPDLLADIYETAEGATYVDSVLGTSAKKLTRKNPRTFPLQQ